MSNRMTETQKWQDAWFVDLPLKYKIFWLYLLDNCDYAGVWEVNWKIAQFVVGDNFEPTEVKRVFGSERILEFNDGRHWYLKKFIEFQQRSSVLNLNSKIILNIYNKLKKYGILDKIDILFYPSPRVIVKEKEKAKAIVIGKGTKKDFSVFNKKVYVEMNVMLASNHDKIDIFNALSKTYTEYELSKAWEDIVWHKNNKGGQP